MARRRKKYLGSRRSPVYYHGDGPRTLCGRPKTHLVLQPGITRCGIFYVPEPDCLDAYARQGWRVTSTPAEVTCQHCYRHFGQQSPS